MEVFHISGIFLRYEKLQKQPGMLEDITARDTMPAIILKGEQQK